MTDLEKFTELYKSFGIRCKVLGPMLLNGGYEIVLKCEDNWSEQEQDVTFSDKFCGYPGFYTVVKFDENGKFYSQGFWE